MPITPEYNREYQRQNIVQKKVIFNRRSEEDLSLLDWVQLQENFSQYCKELIRADMLEKEQAKHPWEP